MLRPLRPAFRRAVCAIALGLLAACSSNDDIPYEERPVEDLYNSAMDDLLAGRNETAAKMFDEVERQHPYSVWSGKAQLMAAYGLYKADRYDEAINALDRFIQLNPANREVAYAYYLRALCYYEQITDVGRDQQMTRLALESLDDVVRRFPETAYATDARLKRDLTLDHLAGKEMSVGRFYLNRKDYLAAINRFRVVVDQYQMTTHVPEALHRLTEAYLALGLTDEARRTASVLGHNYPGSEWYVDSYALLVDGNIREELPGVTQDKSTWQKIKDFF